MSLNNLFRGLGFAEPVRTNKPTEQEMLFTPANIPASGGGLFHGGLSGTELKVPTGSQVDFIAAKIKEAHQSAHGVKLGRGGKLPWEVCLFIILI